MTILVVMGVSGSGKTTIAQGIAAALHLPFQEGDALHAPEAVAKMRGGTPLTDEDRAPWLDRVAAVIAGWRARGSGGVITCSALRRRYRDRIIGGHDDVRLVYLFADRAVLADRLRARQGHYMPPALLDSQLATLEPPGADEHPIAVDVGGTPDQAVQAVLGAVADLRTVAQPAKTGAHPGR